jgi:hypothetical protein
MSQLEFSFLLKITAFCGADRPSGHILFAWQILSWTVVMAGGESMAKRGALRYDSAIGRSTPLKAISYWKENNENDR